MVNLYKHQRDAVNQLKTGSILCGGVGTGKSITAVSYYYEIECSNMEEPKDLYIITTAAKRDTLDWERECANFGLSIDRNSSVGGVQVKVDSWNNIKKYIKVEDAFFIFDEQRVVGSGSWVRSFYKITKANNWILLSATPGDTWMDYIPSFVANGFYKNRSEFLRIHVVYRPFARFPKIDKFIEEGRLIRLKNEILVTMPYSKVAISHYQSVDVEYDKEKFELVQERWNPYTDQPIKDVSEYFFVMRKVVNSDISRLITVKRLLTRHPKIILFYNFNYELDILKSLKDQISTPIAEYNGHKHESIPNSTNWLYLVQYISGSEGWNCIETNAMIFYSQNYSYRMMVQAAGRIDRLNTTFPELFYYTLRSSSPIDLAIAKTLRGKKDFNEKNFIKKFKEK